MLIRIEEYLFPQTIENHKNYRAENLILNLLFSWAPPLYI